MPAVAANGITVEYESLGDPANPTVLLVMGLGMQLVAWPDAFCHGLVERGLHVVRFDNRDCGLSSKMAPGKQPNLILSFLAAYLGLPVRAPYLLEDMAGDALGVLDALDVRQAHFVGMSLGGMIGQVAAAKHPDRVKSLTSIMSSSGIRTSTLSRPRAARALLSKPRDPNDVDVVVDHIVHIFDVIGSPGFHRDREEMRRMLELGVRRCYFPPGAVRQLLAICASGDRRSLLKGIRVPSLVIHGTDDPLIPVAAGRDTARHIPNAKLMVIKGMGHDLATGLQPLLVDAIASHCLEADSLSR